MGIFVALLALATSVYLLDTLTPLLLLLLIVPVFIIGLLDVLQKKTSYSKELSSNWSIKVRHGNFNALLFSNIL